MITVGLLQFDDFIDTNTSSLDFQSSGTERLPKRRQICQLPELSKVLEAT